MIEKIDNDRCTGCTACASICPHGCITMVENQEGFDEPILDNTNCIYCHLCEQVCPLDKSIVSSYKTKTIAFQYRDESVRAISSAGGFIGAISGYVFENNGVLYGAGFDTENIVRHFRVSCLEECIDKKLFASKYVTSDLSNTFKNIKADLVTGRLVCFVGLPCQVAGLKSYLKKDYENLLLIDLTCYGVPSRKIYKLYLDYLKVRFNSEIKEINFRDKFFGYSAPTMSVEFTNGRRVSQNSDIKSYLRIFFKNLSIRKSCQNCSFKGVERVSDFTIGDCKNIKAFVPEYDDDKGTTVVYIHSLRAEDVLQKLFNCRMIDVPMDKILSTCGKKMEQRVILSPKRADFFNDIDLLSYKEVVDKYCPADTEEKIANIVKRILEITGLNNTSILRRLKRR